MATDKDKGTIISEGENPKWLKGITKGLMRWLNDMYILEILMDIVSPLSHLTKNIYVWRHA